MPTTDIKTLCPYCGVGCGLIATTDGRKVLRVRGDPKHPSNMGGICRKGATVPQTINVRTRLRHAMVKDDHGNMAIVPPARAVRDVAERLRKIIEQHGRDSVAFYLSGQLTTESQYLANKFAKGFLRTNNVDSNSRLCMASAASGMKLSLGSDGPPTCYADIDTADAFFFIGSNAADCHPVVFDRVKRRLKKGGVKCVVADPRRTATAEEATHHLRVRPGTDLTLLNGMLRLFRDFKTIDPAFIAAHTRGWEQMNELLDEYTPEHVADVCGIAVDEFIAATKTLARRPKMLTFWTMGINQNLTGTFASNAIINLHLATGRIGKPGAGPFSLTGQPNAMGGRDCGYMSHALPGYRVVDDPEHRRHTELLWGLPADTISAKAGHDAVSLFDAMESGRVKAVWIIGSNPAASMPNLPNIRRALERAELVIVQDAYFPTETTKYAHIVLPAAVNLEQTGTFCNSERRVTLMEQVVPPPGDALPDWQWVRDVAVAMGHTVFERTKSAEDIFDEFARSTAGRPNDQSALYYDVLRKLGPQQWPCPAQQISQQRRYLDHQFHTPDRRAVFFARRPITDQERTSTEYPLLLTTGRIASQWHTRTKTQWVDQLNKTEPAPFASLHPADARVFELHDDQIIEISSTRGTVRTQLRIDEDISPGVIFMPMHWGNLFADAASPNEATTDDVDAISKQPALKCVPVRVAAVAVADGVRNPVGEIESAETTATVHAMLL